MYDDDDYNDAKQTNHSTLDHLILRGDMSNILYD